MQVGTREPFCCIALSEEVDAMHAIISRLVAKPRGAGKPAPQDRARFTAWIRKTIPTCDRIEPPLPSLRATRVRQTRNRTQGGFP